MNLFALLSFFQMFLYAKGVDYDGWLNIKLYHKINCKNEEYCLRGNIALKSIRTGNALIDQIHFNEQHIKELKKLANMDGFYTMKSIVTSGEIKEAEFISSVKAKNFLDHNLSDVINAWMLPCGTVIAVTFQTKNISDTTLLEKNLYKPDSKFYLRFVEQAPVPDTASYIQKLEREKEAREKGELKDNRSFLAKYWMYIVPVFLILMLSGAANPEQGTQNSN